MGIYFINDLHRENFEKLLVKFPSAQGQGNGSYTSTCYIAALPEIFKCFTLAKQVHGPMDWYIQLSDPDLTDEQFETAKKERGATLAPITSGTRALCEFACSLWNGRSCALDDITDIDAQLYVVVLQALDLRRRLQLIEYNEALVERLEAAYQWPTN